MSFRVRNDESGFALVEVLVSALLVALVSIGMLAALDHASATSGNQRARAQASSFAQQDQERLRAMSPANVKALEGTPQASRTRTLPLNGRTFTIVSTVTSVTENSTSTGCSASSTTTTYLHIQSDVSWTDRGNTAHASEESELTVPPSGGSVVVRVRKGDRSPQGGVTVNLTGPTSVSPKATTLPYGCVQWDNLAPGSYTAAFNKTGYVTPSGASSVSTVVQVTTGGARILTFDYDLAGQVRADFQSTLWTTTTTSHLYSAAAGQGTDRLTVLHTSLPTPRMFGTTGTLAPSITTTGDITGSAGLFPFTTPYSLYPGSCSGEDPGTAGRTSVTVDPSQTQPQVATVALPAVNVRVQWKNGSGGTGTPINGATVKLTRSQDGCPSMVLPTQLTADDSWRGGSGWLVFPGVPPGTYRICGETNGHYLQQSNVVVAVGQKPSPTIVFDVHSNDTSGTCP